ncbi:hypothetical protein [Staphylococcus hominis]|uniref:hypothetical protein n=1 Tax=Staphylococcus hominis TaxID=1290 RepID=UPI001F543DB0|nr:hypothetical protein [Staphylococcus hominis]WRY66725.1 hypothetical protein P8632_05475 [Staphylococcus hominis]
MEIIKTYDSLINQETGDYYTDRYVLAVPYTSLNSEGKIIGDFAFGSTLHTVVPCATLIIDENIYSQLENLRLKIIDGVYKLVAPDGYEFVTVEETESEEDREIRELEEMLAKLRAKKELK